MLFTPAATIEFASAERLVVTSPFVVGTVWRDAANASVERTGSPDPTSHRWSTVPFTGAALATAFVS